MDMIKVTVLTAVYNAENYLQQCLDSLKNQTLNDCQFICIDDCSTDGSAEILQRYAAEDSRFQILHTPVNSGQAVARNLGLQFAKGEYVAMLDADDWLAPDALMKAYDTIKETPECDCALFRVIQVRDGSEADCYNTPNEPVSGQEAFRLSLDWQIHGVYLIDRRIHQKYPYDTACRLYSDDNTTRIHYLHSRRVAFSDAIYFYRQHPESTTHRFTPMRFLFMDAFSSMKVQILAEANAGNIDCPEEVIGKFENLRWLNYVSLVRYFIEHRKKMSATERADIRKRLAEKLRTFEFDRIALRYRCRPGYVPVKCWKLFYCQQMIFMKVYPLYSALRRKLS